MDVSKFNLFGVLFNFKDKKARDDHEVLAQTVSTQGTDIANLKTPAFSEPEANADVRTAVGNVTGNKPIGTLFTNIKAALNGLITLGEMRNYLVNNGTVTETGKYFLDAAYGKTLLDQITALNSDFQDVQDLLYSIRDGSRLSGVNLNNYLSFTVGYTNDAINKPAGVSNGYFEAIPAKGGVMVLQRYTPYNSNAVYTRQKTNDRWTEWKQI